MWATIKIIINCSIFQTQFTELRAHSKRQTAALATQLAIRQRQAPSGTTESSSHTRSPHSRILCCHRSGREDAHGLQLQARTGEILQDRARRAMRTPHQVCQQLQGAREGQSGAGKVADGLY